MQHCVRCHKDDLNGIEGALKGDAFMERRREDTVETLYLDIKATMPRGNAGRLPADTYVDLIAYILQANGFPEGSDELRVELLEGIQVVGKNGPAPVPRLRSGARRRLSGSDARKNMVPYLCQRTGPHTQFLRKDREGAESL
jgi:hypothetical protein